MMLVELLALGVTEIGVACTACGTVFSAPIAALDLPDETDLSQVTKLHPIVCPDCSAPGAIVSPM